MFSNFTAGMMETASVREPFFPGESGLDQKKETQLDSIIIV
jgi:hypothetical protein